MVNVVCQLCELFLPFGKPMLVYAVFTLDIGRENPWAWAQVHAVCCCMPCVACCMVYAACCIVCVVCCVARSAQCSGMQRCALCAAVCHRAS